jgi:diguanylate cyclase (GGDEF)-like protein/PAS domain S-box-containing protein
MRVIKRLQILSTSTITAVIVLLPILFWAFVHYQHEKNDYVLMDQLHHGFFDLTVFRDQYFLYREERARGEWDIHKEIVNQVIDRISDQHNHKEDEPVLKELRRSFGESANIFQRIVENSESLKSATDKRSIYDELDHRLVSQLLLRSTKSLNLASALLDISAQRVEKSYQYLVGIVCLFALLLALTTILSSMRLSRLINKRLLPLHQGAKRIAGGNLDYRIICDGTDEFSELAASINAMTARLQTFTEQLQAEIVERERLAKEREQYFRFFRLTTEPMCIADPKGCFKQVNPAFISLTGFDESELLTQPFIDFVFAEDRQKTEDEMTHQILGQKSMAFENRYHCKDGRLVCLSWTAYFDRVEGVTYATARDITERKHAETQLAESQFRWKFAIEGSGDGVWDWNIVSNEVNFSRRYKEMLGYSDEDIRAVKQEWTDRIHPDDRANVTATLQDYLLGQIPTYSIEFRMKCKDGSYKYIHARGMLVSRSHDGKPLRMIGTHTDITERKQAQQKLQLAASVFSNAREGIMITETDGTIIDVNDAFILITGYSREEAVGRNPRILNSDIQSPDFYARLWRRLQENGHWYGEIWNRRKNGEVYAQMENISAIRDAQGNVCQYVSLFSDITTHKEHEKKLEHIAHFDALTNLPNRVLLADRLRQAMAQTDRNQRLLAIVYLDLDGFKAINDTYGHAAGDRLLMAVSERMKQTLREVDTLARMGGDEFVAVLPNMPDAASSIPMLNRLLAAASKPIETDDIAFTVSASLGVTFFPQVDDVDADQLLRQADQAMYQAKLAGKNRFYMFDTDQDISIRNHHESLNRIRQALVADELVLYYQPKVNLRTGGVIGAEALIRWQHPESGLLPPSAFLPIIEEHPLAVEIGEWVIDTALTQIQIWHNAGLKIPVSVNIGARQLQQKDFVDRLRQLLVAHTAISHNSLELEVLETSALEDISHVSDVINACSEMGVAFALDDFGTGYSSLTYLKRLPVAMLKIDQSFVRDMLDDPDDLSILNGVISLAAAFGKQVIAEGVESQQHGDLLLQLGCELAQGYGIAKPMPAEEMLDWHTNWSKQPHWPDHS